MLLTILLQGVGRAEVVAGILLIISLAMVIGGVRVISNWPDGKNGKVAVGGTMIVLPFSAALVVGGLYITDGYMAWWGLLLVPASWLIWIALAIFSAIYIRADDAAYTRKREEQRARNAARNPLQPYTLGSPPDVQSEIKQQTAPAAAPTPAKPKDAITAETPVIARCTACMGRWKTTAGEAKALQACPKCGASPAPLRLQNA